MSAAEPSKLLDDLVTSLDLEDYEDMATGTVVLTNPKTLAPTTSHVILASKDHPARKKIDLARTRKLRASFNQTGKLPVTDPVEDIEDETEYLVAATLGWNLQQGGQPLEFSPEAARKLYTDPKKQWVRNQVKAGLEKSELFIKNSVKP